MQTNQVSDDEIGSEDALNDIAVSNFANFILVYGIPDTSEG
jgi:hypothetical protein